MAECAQVCSGDAGGGRHRKADKRCDLGIIRPVKISGYL